MAMSGLDFLLKALWVARLRLYVHIRAQACSKRYYTFAMLDTRCCGLSVSPWMFKNVQTGSLAVTARPTHNPQHVNSHSFICLQVLGKQNLLVEAVRCAFFEHYPLVLSPGALLQQGCAGPGACSCTSVPRHLRYFLSDLHRHRLSCVQMSSG